MDVGIRELKLRLSAYLARVQEGETLVITCRGKPMAKLERVVPQQPPGAIRHLVEAGLLIYKSPRGPLPRPLKVPPGKSLAEYVTEDRR